MVKRLEMQNITLSRQRGVALFFALMFLLLLTLLGLTSSNVSVMQERMAGNYAQSQTAFQLAESTLRQVEAMIMEGCSTGGSGGLTSISSLASTSLEINDCTAHEFNYEDTSPKESGDWRSAPSPIAQPGGGGWASYQIHELPPDRCQPGASLRIDEGEIHLTAYLVVAAGVSQAREPEGGNPADVLSGKVVQSIVSCVN